MPLQELGQKAVEITSEAFAFLMRALTEHQGGVPPSTVRLCTESTLHGAHPLWRPCKCHKEDDLIILDQDGVKIVVDLDAHPELEGTTVELAEDRRLVFRKRQQH
jgi:Fe-S cluster assembly iron-binding protein IscA